VGATFNIGSQNAASIQNIGGDAVIHRVDATASWEIHELRESIARAQEQAATLALPPELRAALERALNSAAGEAAKEQPDKGRIADLLAAAGRTLKEAGAAVSGGSALFEALKHAATLLGPVGAAVLALI
jgi:hypothetical protein